MSNKSRATSNESDNDSSNLLIKLLKKLFSFLFGENNSFDDTTDADPRQLSNNLDEINNALAEYRDKNLADGKFLNAYIAENQRIGFSAIQSQTNNVDCGFSAQDISKIAMKNINEKMNDLNCSDRVSSEFQNYKNHDIERINSSIGDVESVIKSKISKDAWPDAKIVNGIISSLNDKASSFLTTPPLSPNEKIERENQSYEQSMDIIVENKVENKNENNSYEL